jgi:hypothetical protein
MDIATMKEEQKKVNAQNAIILKAMNRKKDKFNFFTLTEHKRNKAEQKLYLLLNDDQKQDIKLICDVLGLNMDFFNYWNGRNHKIYISNNILCRKKNQEKNFRMKKRLYQIDMKPVLEKVNYQTDVVELCIGKC